METRSKSNQPSSIPVATGTAKQARPILSQTLNNTTLWIGHLQHESNDRLGGQTFSCPADGLVNNIQVYSSAVTQPGAMMLTLHEFDPGSRTWGPAIGQSRLQVEKNDTSKWIRFELDPVALHRNSVYGFRLQSIDAIIGIGEAASHAKRPFDFGHEWNSDNSNQGKYFSYFSLAFKVEMCA